MLIAGVYNVSTNLRATPKILENLKDEKKQVLYTAALYIRKLVILHKTNTLPHLTKIDPCSHCINPYPTAFP